MRTPLLWRGRAGGGDNTNNTTQAELEALTDVEDGSFFNHVFTLGNGAGVYIGYRPDPGGPVGYALSGMHLGSPSTLTIEGTTYNVQSHTAIDGSDLALFAFTHPDNIMPALSALSLSSTTPVDGTDVVMVGIGRNRVQDATTDANVSDAVSVTDGTGYTTTSSRLKRWGTNTTADFGPGPGGPGPTHTFDIGGRDTDVFRTIFDEPDSGDWLTSNQAQGVTNDSGGGVFSHDGLLLGIMVSVQASNASEAAFGNTTLMADVATYKDEIDVEIEGMLIPEPGTAVLMLCAIALLYGMRQLGGVSGKVDG